MPIPPSCALVFVCAVAGCISQGSEAAERQTDSAARRDSVAAVAAASMTEEQVAGLLEYVHAADSELGVLGSTKGTATEVKEFGRMIMREHQALRRDIVDLARGLRITPTSPRVAPDMPPVAMRNQLNTANPGPIWDQAYLDYAVAMHQSAMENSARALAATKSPAAKQLIEKSVPIIQKHFDKANSLRRSLATTPEAAPPPPTE